MLVFAASAFSIIALSRASTASSASHPHRAPAHLQVSPRLPRRQIGINSTSTTRVRVSTLTLQCMSIHYITNPPMTYCMIQILMLSGFMRFLMFSHLKALLLASKDEIEKIRIVAWTQK